MQCLHPSAYLFLHMFLHRICTIAMKEGLSCIWQASLDEAKETLLCYYVGQWKCESSGGTGSKPATVIAPGQNTDAH